MQKHHSLAPELLAIIQDKGTEHPFTGAYTDQDATGTYLCRQCGLALFRASHKFHSGCGWPSFDKAVSDHIKREPDQDGKRTEILCTRCDAHLGHVFTGEGFTNLSTRHCVNSASLDFVTDQNVLDTEEAILAAGCFWGVEYYLKQLPGVLKTEVGYTGGNIPEPTYEAVCTKKTGHFEAIRVVYDPKKIDYKTVLKYFFEIHDPSQTDGQGPDLGPQYLSAVFYYHDQQKATAIALLKLLQDQGMRPATQVLPVVPFWPAELYHQDYYSKTGKAPYCHTHIKRFES